MYKASVEKFEFVRENRILHLAQNSRMSSFASLFLIALYFFTLSNEMQISQLQVIAASCLSLCLVLRLYKAFNVQENWHLHFSMLSFFVAAGWAATFILVFSAAGSNPKVLLISFTVMAGLISSASYSLSISKRDYLLFILLILAPLFYMFNWNYQGTTFQMSGNFILGLFFLYLVQQRVILEGNWLEQVMKNFELQKMMNLFPGGIAVLRGGLYVRSNSYFEQLLKERKTSSSVVKFLEMIKQFSDEKKERRLQLEWSLPCHDVSKTHFVSVENIETFEGLETVVAVVDIDQYKKIETENTLHKAHLEQNAKMAALGVMSSGLAHEINNPLATILGRVQLMQLQIKNSAIFHDPSFPAEKFTNSLTVIDKTVKRISKIIKGLRSFARDTEGDPFEVASLQEIIETTLSFCETRIQNSGIQFDNLIQEPILIECRPTEISQVLLNALNNSFDAIANLENKWIKLESENLNGSVVIKITDSGPGISENVREKLMIPFFTTKDVGSGTGLGLSLSKGIIESHGGQFYFNHECKNTQLMIVLPYQRRQAQAS